jgi:hypothetical protein
MAGATVFYVIESRKPCERKKCRFLVLIAAFLIAQITACSTVKVEPFKSRPLSASKNVVSKNNLYVTALPITDKTELEKTFGRDLTEAGVLPVLIMAENRDKDRSFVLSGNAISLSDKRSKVAFAKALRTDAADTSAGNAVGIIGVIIIPVGILPGVIISGIGGRMVGEATITNRSMVSAEFYTRTVSPGKTVGGLVYFKLPSGAMNIKELSLLVQAQELGTATAHEFEISLQEERRI